MGSGLFGFSLSQRLLTLRETFIRKKRRETGRKDRRRRKVQKVADKNGTACFIASWISNHPLPSPQFPDIQTRTCANIMSLKTSSFAQAEQVWSFSNVPGC